MSRENENPLEALVRDFYKGIEVKLQAKTGWGRNDVLDVVRDVQVSVLAKHLAQAIARRHPDPKPQGPPNTRIGSREPPWTP